jgi:16S rRNA processing protein RimM
VVGRVGRPHGLAGAFHVTDPEPAFLRDGAEVLVGGALRRVERRSGTDERPVLKLDGATSREDAEALRGAELAVAAEAVALEPGEYWAHELAGCAVVDGERRVGVVRRMVALPSCEALEVELEDGGELLVPMVRDAVRAVDVAGRRVDVDTAFLGGP